MRRVDDVEDNSELRRGAPVAHSIFGVAQTINTANYVYFCALEEVAKLEKPECLRIYTGGNTTSGGRRRLKLTHCPHRGASEPPPRPRARAPLARQPPLSD